MSSSESVIASKRFFLVEVATRFWEANSCGVNFWFSSITLQSQCEWAEFFL